MLRLGALSHVGDQETRLRPLLLVLKASVSANVRFPEITELTEFEEITEIGPY